MAVDGRSAHAAAGSELVIPNILLAAGLLLSMATQWRIDGLPLGPGEFCLVIWLLIMLLRVASRSEPRQSPALTRFFYFWVAFVLAESLGTLSGVFIHDDHDTGLFLHDVMAYLLLLPTSCLLVVEPGAALRLHQAAWVTVILGAILLLGQLGNAFVFSLPIVTPWYWDRLRGWSDNPNQLALVCVVLTILPLHLADTTARPAAAVTAIACGALALTVGILTKSDTFRLAVAATVPVFIGLKLRWWIKLAARRMTFRGGAALIVAIGLPLMLVSALPLAASVSIKTSDFSKNDNLQATREADLRLNAWHEAIDRGVQSGFLGLGPGPHLPIPPSILEARMGHSAGQPAEIEHPHNGAAPNFEAHNTVLDLFAQGGLLADAAFLWLVFSAVVATYRCRLAGLAALMVGLIVFTTAHLIVRLPIFWFSIALCLVAGPRPDAPAIAKYGN